MKREIRNIVIGLLSVFISMIMTACGGGGSDTDTVVTDPIGDLTGKWSVTETVDASACDEGIYNDYYTIDLTSQSENSITVVTNVGTYTGSLNGNKATWSGSHPDDGGTSTGTTSLTIDSSCNKASGTADWTWRSSDGKESCSGSSTISAERDNPVGCGTSPDPEPSDDSLNMFEEDMAQKWSRYHAYDDSYQYFIFNDDRTGCYFEITSSNSRIKERSYTDWRLSSEASGATVFDIILNGSTSTLHEFHYATDEVWYGGYSNLAMSPSSTSRSCN